MRTLQGRRLGSIAAALIAAAPLGGRSQVLPPASAYFIEERHDRSFDLVCDRRRDTLLNDNS